MANILWAIQQTNTPGNLSGIQADTGQTPSVEIFSQTWVDNPNTSTTREFPSSTLNTIRASGCVPALEWYTSQFSIPEQGRCLKGIIAGYADLYISRWASAAAAWGHPFFLIFDIEMNGNWLPGYSDIRTDAGGTTYGFNAKGDYKKMVSHVKSIFTAAGATNVTWVFAPNFQATGTTAATAEAVQPLSQFYDATIFDWTGFHAFAVNGAIGHGSSSMTFSQLIHGGVNGLDDTYAHMVATCPGKPRFLSSFAFNSEQGSNVNANWNTAPIIDGNYKASVFNDMLGTQMPGATNPFDAFAYFQQDGAGATVPFSVGYSYHGDAPFEDPTPTAITSTTTQPDGVSRTWSVVGAGVGWTAFKNQIAGTNYVKGGTTMKVPADLTPIQAYTTAAPTFVVVPPTGSQLTATSFTFTFTTNVPTTTWAEIGLTTSYGTSAPKSDLSPYVKAHTVTFAGLTAGTTYHVRARGEDSWANVGTSADFTVRTLDAAGGTDTYLAAEAAIGGRVAHWRLGDGAKASGSTMADVLGTYNGTYQGNPVDASGLLATSTSHALSVDGATWGQVTNNVAFSLEVGAGAKMTLSAWVKLSALPAATVAVAAKGSNSNWEYAIQIQSTGAVTAIIWQSNGTSYITAQATIPGGLTLGVAHRVALVYDASLATAALQLQVYWDGVSQAGGVLGGGTAPSAGTAMFTIAERAAADQRMGTVGNPAIVQDVVLRNNANTAAQEASLYSAGFTTVNALATSTVGTATQFPANTNIMVASDGLAIAVFATDALTLQFAASVAPYTSWSTTALATNLSNGRFAASMVTNAADPDLDDVDLVWCSNNGTNSDELNYAKLNRAGAAWVAGTPVAVMTHTELAGAAQPVFVIRDNNATPSIWIVQPSTNQGIFFATRTSVGTTWSNPAQLNSPAAPSTASGALALALSGIKLVLVSQPSAVAAAWKAWTLDTTAGTPAWTATAVAPNYLSTAAMTFSADTDSSGKVMVVWNGAGGILAAKYTVGTNTWDAASTALSATASDAYPSVDAIGNSKVYAQWLSGTTIVGKAWSGSAWDGAATTFSASTGTAPAWLTNGISSTNWLLALYTQGSGSPFNVIVAPFLLPLPKGSDSAVMTESAVVSSSGLTTATSDSAALTEIAVAAPLAAPQMICEISFVDPNLTPVWTDVTKSLQSFTTHRGRSFELDRIEAGTATITLNNRDHAFDPANIASPYFPNVISMRRIRLSIRYFGVTYRIFTGYVERWPQNWRNFDDAWTTVEAVDGFKVFALAKIPSAYAPAVLVDTPMAYWRLGERSGTTAVDEIAGRNGTYNAGSTVGVTGALGADSNTAVKIAGVGDITIPHDAAFNLTGDMTVEAWIYPTSNADQQYIISKDNYTGGNTTTDTFSFYLENGTSLPRFDQTVLLGGSPTNFTSVGTVPVPLNQWSHVAATKQGQTVTHYLNGAFNGNALTFSGTQTNTLAVRIGSHNDLIPSMIWAGSLDEVALYSYALTASRVRAHVVAGTGNIFQQQSGERINTVLDAVGWPTSDRRIDTGQSIIQATTISDFALSHLQLVGIDSELGLLFVDGAGSVVFLDRSASSRAASYNVQTYGPDPGQLAFADVTPSVTDDTIWNVIEVTATGGVMQSAMDTPSIGHFFARTLSKSVLVTTDVAAASLAQGLLLNYKDQRYRFDQMVVDPVLSDTHKLEALQRDIGDRLHVQVNWPSGPVISQAVVIQSVSHNWDAAQDNWTVTWDLAPSYGQFWLLGVAGSSELGVTTTDGW